MYGGRGLKSLVRRSKYRNLDIVPSMAGLEQVNRESDARGLDANELRRQIDSVADRYDFVVIDCQPTMQFLTISALYAADLVVVPFKAAGFSMNGLELMQDYLADAAQQRHYDSDLLYACLPVMFNGRKKSIDRIRRLMELDAYAVFDTFVRFSAVCENAEDQSVRKPLLKHRRKSKVAADYLELTKEILLVMGE